MDNGVPPIDQRPVERRTTERRSTPRATSTGSGDRRKAPPKPRKPQPAITEPAATETVADRIDPLMNASAPPRRAATPRKRAPAPRPEDRPSAAIDVSERIAAELPTAEVQVFDDLLVFDDLAAEKPAETVAERVIEPPVVEQRRVKKPAAEKPKVAEPVSEKPISADLDFFDDLDFERRVPEPVVAPEPYVLPKIIPGEPDPVAEEPATDLVTTAPELKRSPRKLNLRTAFQPQFTRVARTTKKLARSLQPVVLPRHRPRVRRVTRVVRHIDTWSVFKIAVLFNIFLYAVCLTAGVMLWRVALNTGTIENIERFFESFGWQTFELKGGEIYHNAWIAGLFGVVGLTGLAVLAATMFNLITDLVGGVRVTVLEEEVTAREPHVVTWPRLLRPATPPHDTPPSQPPID